MGIVRKLFGSRSKPAVAEVATGHPRTVEDLRKDPNLIRVFDKYGRELFLTKEQWRKDILPESLRANWSNADQLYDAIVGALNDGFYSDVVAAAHRLFQIDTDHARATCVWGIVLLEDGRLDEAEKVYRDYEAQHGANGYVLTNLAKVYAKRNDLAQSETTLWHALELDPNQENAVGWYLAIHRERGGEAEGLHALQRIAALRGSWRAQLWIARAALNSNDLAQAMELYRKYLAGGTRPVPSDALMQISGDLGNAGHLQEILQLVEPQFDPAVHGLLVGNNLIKAHIDLKQVQDARRILNALYALKRPDWRESLRYWETEIDKAEMADGSSPQPDRVRVNLLLFEGPIWLKPESPAAQLFPRKADDSPVIFFLGSSVQLATKAEKIESQLADTPGRMSRALPLFFAEQIEFGTNARTRAIFPWVFESEGGFVVSGVRWSDKDAVAFSTRESDKSDYLVISHLDARTDEFTADVRLIRCGDGECVGQLFESFSIAAPMESIVRMSRQLRELLFRMTSVKHEAIPPAYALPEPANFSAYLLRLEQLLAVRCSSLNGAAGFLHGERDIIDGNLQLVLSESENVNARILFAQTLLAMKRVRPEILREFTEKIALLQQEHRLADPAHSVVQELIDDALAG